MLDADCGGFIGGRYKIALNLSYSVRDLDLAYTSKDLRILYGFVRNFPSLEGKRLCWFRWNSAGRAVLVCSGVLQKIGPRPLRCLVTAKKRPKWVYTRQTMRLPELSSKDAKYTSFNFRFLIHYALVFTWQPFEITTFAAWLRVAARHGLFIGYLVIGAGTQPGLWDSPACSASLGAYRLVHCTCLNALCKNVSVNSKTF